MSVITFSPVAESLLARLIAASARATDPAQRARLSRLINAVLTMNGAR